MSRTANLHSKNNHAFFEEFTHFAPSIRSLAPRMQAIAKAGVARVVSCPPKVYPADLLHSPGRRSESAPGTLLSAEVTCASSSTAKAAAGRAESRCIASAAVGPG